MIGPSARLLATLAVLTVSSVLIVLFPAVSLVFAAAVLALGVTVIWDTYAVSRLCAPALRREHPERAFLDCDTTLRLHITNENEHDVLLDVIDELPRDVAAADPTFRAVAVPANGTRTLESRARPTLRGDRELGPIVALLHSPLGLLRRRIVQPATEPLRVYPDIARYLRSGSLDVKHLLHLLGAKVARRRGTGMEFESLRDYVPGDDPRSVSWSASARRGRPVVRLNRHERNHTVVIAVDTSRLMASVVGRRTKLDHAVDSALALALGALGAEDRVSLIAFDSEVRGYVPPTRKRDDLGRLIDILRPLQPRRVEASYHALARLLAARQKQRALVVLLSDFIGADEDGFLAPLTTVARRHQLLFVALRDPLLTTVDQPGSGDDSEIYRRIVLDELLRQREVALQRLKHVGLDTIDVDPDQATTATLNRYLALRSASD